MFFVPGHCIDYELFVVWCLYRLKNKSDEDAKKKQRIESSSLHAYHCVEFYIGV
jgi:hypothetical protein